MKSLISINTGLPIAVGAVVQDTSVPGLVWVKVKAVNLQEGLVQLSGLKPVPWQAWHVPGDIGAYFRDPKENSLAGGRCSSSGLSGHAKVVLDSWCPTVQIGGEAAKGFVTSFTGGHADPRHSLTVSGPELDAILAGLRLLAREVGAGNVKFSDDDLIGHVWTNSGDHDGLAPPALHALADRLNGG